MIKSFSCEQTEMIWLGNKSRRFPSEIQNTARRKLRMLNNSFSINDLRVATSNRLEKLKGNLKGYYSLRVHDKYRIIFKWKSSNAHEVKIIDYHG
jgi:proteic killer suppression protein